LFLTGWSGASAPTGISITWGGTPLTLISNTQVTGSSVMVMIFGLVNPASGAQTLAGSWTGATNFAAAAISFTGVDQSSVAGAFPSGISNSGTGTTPSVSVNSKTSDLVVGVFANNSGESFVSTSGTTIFASGANVNVAGNRDNGASSVSLTATLGSSVGWVAAGVNVAAVSDFVIYDPRPQWLQCWRHDQCWLPRRNCTIYSCFLDEGLSAAHVATLAARSTPMNAGPGCPLADSW
jgi:hypothetical protein